MAPINNGENVCVPYKKKKSHTFFLFEYLIVNVK